MPFKVIFNSFLVLLFIITVSCSRNRIKGYTYHPAGYYYKLISFETPKNFGVGSGLHKVQLSFTNQNDSVFWDSYNNYNDFFILNTDTSKLKSLLGHALVKFNVGDSGSILIRNELLFKQQFNFDRVPYFSENDSMVKVNFKIKGSISHEGLLNLQNNLILREKNKIEDFFGSPINALKQLDSLGFYWVSKPNLNNDTLIPKYGNKVVFTYEGTYLNGRFLEKSPENFEMILGTPDQVIKGLNYAIQRLKIGQSAKIILPSHLAFGAGGSTNGLVPPFTPLVYQVKLIDIKN